MERQKHKPAPVKLAIIFTHKTHFEAYLFARIAALIICGDET